MLEPSAGLVGGFSFELSSSVALTTFVMVISCHEPRSGSLPSTISPSCARQTMITVHNLQR